MKRHLLSIILTGMLSLILNQNIIAQEIDKMNSTYDKEWKLIDSLLNQKRLPKSALEKIDLIWNSAIKDGNEGQQIKALIYWSNATQQVAENTKDTLLPVWIKNINKTKGIQKAIMQSILAEMVWNYLENNRWQIQGRTKTEDYVLDDLATWSLSDFEKQASELYLASVGGKEQSMVPIDKYSAIFNKGLNGIELRPTVFDVLAERAVSHFTNTRTHLSVPINPFRLIDTSLFEAAEIFTKHTFVSTDSISPDYHIVRLLQDWLSLHINDNEPRALIDIDLLRLDYVFQNSPLKYKKRYYKTALEYLSTKYPRLPANAEFNYRLAQMLIESGNKWDGKSEKGKNDLKDAYEMASNAYNKFPGSFGGANCKSLIQQLAAPVLNVQLESVYNINKPMLGFISYKNLSEFHYRIIKSDDNIRKAIEQILNKQGQPDVYEYLRKLKYIQTDQATMPDPKDYREHSVEFMMKGLLSGEYLILFSSDPDFRYGVDKPVGYTNFTISNLGIWLSNNSQKSNIIVTDRITGKPLKGVAVKIIEVKNEYQNREYRTTEKVMYDKLLTDHNGSVSVVLIKNERQYSSYFKIIASTKDDNYQLTSYNNYYSEPLKYQALPRTYFFTDRSIYRPGQSIYFKALVVEKKERGSRILVNQLVKISFFDTNGKLIEEKSFTTNQYGSVNGSFTAPLSGLRGQMRLQSSLDGMQWISVEEYKRPTFEVLFDKITAEFSLGDKIKLTGKVQAFAGNMLSGTKVNYRVIRKTAYPYWFFYRFMPGNVATQEIINGTTITDDKGSFTVQFSLLPDDNDDPSKKPIYTYELVVDASDQVGETRTGSTSVRAGYVSVELYSQIPEHINKDERLMVDIKTLNLNGVMVKTPYSISISSLKSPGYLINKKYWEQPEYQIIPEAVYRKSFPNFAYAHEDKFENWHETDKVYISNFESSIDSFIINTVNWKPGKYAFTIQLKDNAGNPLIIKKYFDILSNNNADNFYEIGIDISTDKFSYQPGDVVNIKLKSPRKAYQVYYEISRNNLVSKPQWITVKENESIKLTVEESDRGNITARFYYIYANRKFEELRIVKVPWTNKELKIEYLSFRDKLLPGQNESWKIKVSGSKKEKVMTELTASMYDASLDYFKPHGWSVNLFDENNYINSSYEFFGFNSVIGNASSLYKDISFIDRVYPQLEYFGFYPSLSEGRIMFRGGRGEPMMAQSMDAVKSMPVEAPRKMKKESNGKDLKFDINAPPPPMSDEKVVKETKDIPVRQNLKETVFFIPSVNTDPDGNYIIDFKMNEALTSWKLMLFVHTKELAYTFDSKIAKTQKDLMIQPNMPRFLRQGDTISLSARVSNLSNNDLKGAASIQLIDVLSGQDITKVFGTDNITQFLVKGTQNTAVSWKIIVPENWMSPVEYKVIATSGELADGEGGILPILSDRMLVTETLPLPVRAGQTKTFTLKSLKENQSKSLQSFNYTLEFTSNPVWYAVKALPYLSEYPYECSEQIFSRIYANVLASYVANKNPKYKENYDKWKANGGLQSKLSTNQELKTTLLEETPWVQNSDTEEDLMQKMANLFDIMRIKDETESALHKLVERQMQDGGFSWFPGGRSDWYITQYLMEGFAHLDRLKVMPQDEQYKQLINKGMEFIDFKFLENYNDLKRQVKEGKAKWEDDHLSQIITHYLYTTSFNVDKKWDDEIKTARDYYLGQMIKYWNNKSVYDQGLMSLVLNRIKSKKEALNIVKSLSERAIFNEELGMYWKSDWGYYWYQMPVETQSLMIEVYDEVANDNKSVDELRVWLLKNKQTNDWKTTKATVEAIYSLLLTGSDWVSVTLDPEITVGKHKIDVASLPKEPGTGYFKTSYRGESISKEMATITVKNPNKQIAWGGIYWQYFEKLENINTFKETPLTIKKAYFKVENSDRGPIMKTVSDKNILKKGDKLRVRIEIKVDRDMEYVHLKDMRGSGFEPVNVLSSYKWQGGLGYYESTRDAATDFFISYLPKGIYVFEYDLRSNASGSFSMGISTIQCMYAPEFSSHSKGERISIK